MDRISSSHLHVVNQTRFPQPPKTQYIQNYPNDSFEFLDKEVEDTPSFKDRIKSLFGKNNSPVEECKTATAEMQQNAHRLFFEAMRTKKEVQQLISAAEIYGFRDIIGLDGNPIKFDEDNLGRRVMIECNENSEAVRRTTFYKNTNEIQSIETADSKNSTTKIVFFNSKDKYFEIRKESGLNCVGNYREDIYCYQHNKPQSYIIKKGNIFKTDVKREFYTF